MDLFRAGPHLVSRAGGEGHQKPDWYYLALLAGGWSGVMVLALAIWGAFRYPYKTAGNKAFGAVVIYTIAIIFLYSVIPYKTPWLALNFFLPLCLLAGNGLAELGRISRSPGGRMAVVFFAAALCAALGRDTWQRVFAAPADEHNPYAYAQTDEDFLRLPKLIQQLAENTPARRNLRIAVVAADAWPLPWYLRRFPNTGFWQPGQDPGGADIYITSSEVPDDLNARLKNWRPEFFGVRPEVLMVVWRPPESEPPHE
jgi:predicted membrane-bound mannosyltransferase